MTFELRALMMFFFLFVQKDQFIFEGEGSRIIEGKKGLNFSMEC